MSARKSKRKNVPRGANSALANITIAWAIVIALTALRLHVALSGSLNEQEAFLSVCARHPQGAYVEGPAGMPLLLALDYRVFGSGIMALRWISPVAALLLSWSVWWLAHRLAPGRPSVAFWSLLGVNLLPPINLASLVADGAMVAASFGLLVVVAGWNAAQSSGTRELNAWTLFGAALGVGTLFITWLGWLLPVAVAFYLFTSGRNGRPSRGFLLAFGLLGLGWILPLEWNFRHDWIQWSSVAQGFACYPLGGFSISMALVVAFSALLVPPLMLLATSGAWWRRVMILLFVGLAAFSALFLLSPGEVTDLAAGLPSPLGVQGIGNLAREIVSLREARPDARREKAFLVASTPELAALLGEKILIGYPELPGAPSVFASESPSMNSSYAFWPSYADAVVPAAKDLFYNEEKLLSPFLGRNALYITTESPSELPQTITGAFGAVGLLKEVPLTWNGEQFRVRIYQCENYRTLAL